MLRRKQQQPLAKHQQASAACVIARSPIGNRRKPARKRAKVRSCNLRSSVLNGRKTCEARTRSHLLCPESPLMGFTDSPIHRFPIDSGFPRARICTLMLTGTSSSTTSHKEPMKWIYLSRQRMGPPRNSATTQTRARASERHLENKCPTERNQPCLPIWLNRFRRWCKIMIF